MTLFGLINYRLVVAIDYEFQVIFVRFIGTHKQYDKIDAIKFRMEQMGMTKADMVKYLGSQSRVSEILNRKRSLTLGMIKSLYKELKIPAEILLA